jgi:hypothetical protein
VAARFTIEARGDHVFAELRGRESAADMRAFLEAVKDACRTNACPSILISVRDSRPVFKAEDYGLTGEMRGYASSLATPDCRIALIGDTSEHQHAHEYVELVARQQRVNAKAFKGEGEALAWLRASAIRAA